MLVCHVVSSLMFGGGQKVALDLASRLADSADTRTLLVLLGNRIAPDWPAINSPWLRVVSYDGRYNRPGSLIGAARGLRQLFRKHDVNIAHSHGWDADVVVGLARRGLSVRHVVHQHILADWAASPRLIHRARRAITRVALRGSNHWIAVSVPVRQSLRRLRWLPQDAVTVISNGVDLERFSPRTDPPRRPRPVIGAAARLARMKGLEFLIEAVALLNDRGPTCDLVIAGSGPERERLADRAQALGVEDRVILRGFCNDMPAFYRGLDIVALPSVSPEGLPLSILEAMACGLPVVSTNLAGVSDVVTEGKTGALVPPGDPAALASALEPLVRSRETRLSMGRAGRLQVETLFAIDGMVRKVSGVYRQVLT